MYHELEPGPRTSQSQMNGAALSPLLSQPQNPSSVVKFLYCDIDIHGFNVHNVIEGTFFMLKVLTVTFTL